MPFEQQSDRWRQATAQTRADAQKGVYRKGQLDKTMETKNKVKVINKAKVKVNKSTVVEHPYCLTCLRSVPDQPPKPGSPN